jgi:hypothetical protein
MAGTGLPQQFSQTDFAEGLFGGPTAAAVSNPPVTSFVIPLVVVTPIDSIPVTAEVPTAINSTITWDFFRILGVGETIASFTLLYSSTVLSTISAVSSGTTVSAYIHNSLTNGQYASVLCNFIGTSGSQGGRTVTLLGIDSGAYLAL